RGGDPMRRPSPSRKPAHHKPFLEPLEPRQLPSAFVVNSFQDSGPGTLRDAITQANAAAGADTISLPTSGVIKLSSNLPVITDDLTITAGKHVKIDGQNQFGLFSVTGQGTDAAFVGLALVNGSSPTGGAAFFIDAPDGTVAITGTTIRKMTAAG